MGCQSCEGCNSCDDCLRCDNGCQTCDTCEGCESCITCVKCEDCDDSCNVSTGCITKQNFCKTPAGQLVGSFSWEASTDTDELIFSTATWNKIVTFIQNAYSAGREVHGGSCRCTKATGSRPLFDHDIFNDVAYDLYHLGPAPSNPKQRTVARGDLVYGSYFADLSSAANQLRYKTSQCDQCNTTCDVRCNTCQDCNVCESANACNDKCTRCNSCEGCNSCLSKNTNSNCCETESSGDAGAGDKG